MARSEPVTRTRVPSQSRSPDKAGARSVPTTCTPVRENRRNPLVLGPQCQSGGWYHVATPVDTGSGWRYDLETGDDRLVPHLRHQDGWNASGAGWQPLRPTGQRQHCPTHTSQTSDPVQVTGTTWQSVSAGQSHTCAIMLDGTLWCWGFNESGQLGDNTLDSKSTPVAVVNSGQTWPWWPQASPTPARLPRVARCGAGATIRRVSWASVQTTRAKSPPVWPNSIMPDIRCQHSARDGFCPSFRVQGYLDAPQADEKCSITLVVKDSFGLANSAVFAISVTSNRVEFGSARVSAVFNGAPLSSVLHR